MSENNPILQVKDLTVSFNAFAGKVQAVRGVSFDLNKGETLCIVGESGSGKSVTNKAIMGILSKNAVIDRGEILYDGMDLTKLTEEQFCQIRGKRIAMVFQDPLSALNPIMKVGKQITETLCVHQKLSHEQAKKRALELMAAVGIPEPEKRFNQYPFQFSGGMRQRIVIVIALACNPEILICDEPTTALDVTIQSKILDLIKEIKQERNLSVIFITHNMGVVANMADRICVMYAGKIVEFGTCDDIFYHPAHPHRRHVCRQDRGIRHSGGYLLSPGASVYLGAAVCNAGQRKPRKAFLYTGRPAKHADAAQGRCIRTEKPLCAGY